MEIILCFQPLHLLVVVEQVMVITIRLEPPQMVVLLVAAVNKQTALLRYLVGLETPHL